MKFTSNFDKMQCFRVMDEEGQIINSGNYQKLIPNDKI